MQLSAEGEVLVRGPVVMKGYRNLPEETAGTIDAEGWLHTGDIGVFDERGYLRIIDRIKEIIINAAGKKHVPGQYRGGIEEGDWPAGGEELTPTMKLKRRPIADKYAREIEKLYAL